MIMRRGTYTPGIVTVPYLLAKHGITKYKGKLIFPDDNGFHFWVRGTKHEGILAAKKYIDNYPVFASASLQT